MLTKYRWCVKFKRCITTKVTQLENRIQQDVGNPNVQIRTSSFLDILTTVFKWIFK